MEHRLSEYHEATSSAPSQHNVQMEKMEQKVKEQLMSNFYSNRHSAMFSVDLPKITQTSVHPPSFKEASTTSPARSPGSSPVVSPRERKEQATLLSNAGQRAVFVLSPTTPSPPLLSNTRPYSHADSVEWTEYTSAMVPTCTQSSSSVSVGDIAATSKGSVQSADLSEFDPITSGEPH